MPVLAQGANGDASVKWNSTYLANKEKTRIDCHKGIAHRLPHMPPGEGPSDTPGEVVPMPAAAQKAAAAASEPSR